MTCWPYAIAAAITAVIILAAAIITGLAALGYLGGP